MLLLPCPHMHCTARGSAISPAGPSGARWQLGYVLLPILACMFSWAYSQRCTWLRRRMGEEGSSSALRPSEVILTWHRRDTQPLGQETPNRRRSSRTRHSTRRSSRPKLPCQLRLGQSDQVDLPEITGPVARQAALQRVKENSRRAFLICVMATAEPPLSDPGRHHSPRPSLEFRDPTEATHQHVILTPAEYR